MEKGPNSFETKSERIPTYKEIHSMFKELTKGEYNEVRGLEDGQGVCILEVVVPEERKGERTQYEYMRAGQYGKNASLTTEIHKVYYENGEAVGGELVAKFVNGKWGKVLKY